MMAGTYEIGANHFAGGGFMPSPATNAGSGSAQKRTYDGTVQTTRRLTVKQLADANVTETSAVDGKDLVNLSLVGKVVRAEHQHLSFNVMLDDGTGTIECKHFMTSTDDAGRNLEEQRLAEIQQGMYVRVFGHLSKSMGTPSITAFAIRPVTDFNEVTYHLAQIIFQHMHLTKGIDQHSGAGDALAAAAPGMEAFGQGQDGFTPVQQQILEAFRSPQAQNSVQGFAVDDVMGFTSNRFPVDQVLQAIAFLVEEGHLYSTTDDAHWKAC